MPTVPWSLVWERLAIKQQLVERKDVWCFVLLSTTLLTCAFLATVAVINLWPLPRSLMVSMQQLGANAAVCVGKLDLQVIDGLAVSRVDTPSIPARSPGEKSGAVGTHNTCDIRTDVCGEQLKARSVASDVKVPPEDNAVSPISLKSRA